MEKIVGTILFKKYYMNPFFTKSFFEMFKYKSYFVIYTLYNITSIHVYLF